MKLLYNFASLEDLAIFEQQNYVNKDKIIILFYSNINSKINSIECIWTILVNT